MKGGNLCDSYNEKIGKDVYVLDKEVFPNIFSDKNDQNILIKIIYDKDEYKLAKILETNGFVPKIYGYFDCTNNIKIPKYTIQQQRIKAYNFSNPKNKKDLGEITYINKPKNVKYMVMEKIEGESLIAGENREEKIKLHIDEIYRLYNILSDKGYILGDLAARNIILSNAGKIYFIDFDPTYTQNTLKSVSLHKRLSKEKLLKLLMDELNRHSVGKKQTKQTKQTKKYRKSKNKNTKKQRAHYSMQNK